MPVSFKRLCIAPETSISAFYVHYINIPHLIASFTAFRVIIILNIISCFEPYSNQ